MIFPLIENATATYMKTQTRTMEYKSFECRLECTWNADQTIHGTQTRTHGVQNKHTGNADENNSGLKSVRSCTFYKVVA